MSAQTVSQIAEPVQDVLLDADEEVMKMLESALGPMTSLLDKKFKSKMSHHALMQIIKGVINLTLQTVDAATPENEKKVLDALEESGISGKKSESAKNKKENSKKSDKKEKDEEEKPVKKVLDDMCISWEEDAENVEVNGKMTSKSLERLIGKKLSDKEYDVIFSASKSSLIVEYEDDDEETKFIKMDKMNDDLKKVHEYLVSME